MDSLQYNILYSCVDEKKRSNEQFVAEHSFGCVLAGEIHFPIDNQVRMATAGSIGLARRNQLAKTIKVPPSDGRPFKAINVILHQEALRRYCMEHHIQVAAPYRGEAMLELSPDPFMKGYFDSLLPYFEHPDQLSASMAELKTREAIELLLRYDPLLTNFLFDFSEPHKIDLEEYMNRHFTYNVPLSRFARLTGRSLATFKRDFKKIFGTSPEKWLHQKRLEEAHFLIAEKQQSPSNVYLEVGFENLSHFSYAFKQFFGYNPSSI
jgi:AraC family transcriptional regulator, exoenzyme S synthesis regulatory protein ExsA